MVMPTIIQGIIIFMNEFDFTTTLQYIGTHTCRGAARGSGAPSVKGPAPLTPQMK